MTDDLLNLLKAQWRQQPVDMDRARMLVARRERLVRFWTWFNSIGIAVTIAAAAWFIASAWNGKGALVLLGAGALLVALPFMLIEQWWLRRHRFGDYLETPDAVVIQARRQGEISLMVLNGCRRAATILIACALAVWALYVAATVTLSSAVFLSLLWATTAGVLLLWQRRRRRLAELELAECDRISAELQSAEYR